MRGLIANNTLTGGYGTNSIGILLTQGATPEIENNIIFSVSPGGGHCILEGDENDGNAASIRNNALWDLNGNTTLYHMWDGGGGLGLDTVLLVNAQGYAGGNIDNDPQLVDRDGPDDDITTIDDNNWRLQAPSPSEVKTGGLDGTAEGWNFFTDKDEVTRTGNGSTGWSMGAYEQD